VKFDILSDVHLGYTAFNRTIPMAKYFPDKTESDYLLIAGDLSEDAVGDETVKKFLTKASKLYKKVVVVLGNHDYWHLNEDERDETKEFETIPQKFAKFVKTFDKGNKIVVLNNNFVKLDDVWVYGTTLWSDIPPQHFLYIQRCMNDYRCIYREDGNFVTYFDTCKANFVAFNGISDFVSTHRNDKVVILTHHSPSFKSRNPNYDQIIDYAYMNNYDNYIIENPNIVAWVSGHIHNKRDYMIGSTRILANPVGYVGEEGGFAERIYDGKKLVDWHLMSVEI
jgi:3',5'-cyclic AMP phosphodiesterase CpdA